MRKELVWLNILLVLIVGAGVALSAPNDNECTKGTACQPFNPDKPCAKSQRMDLRFGLVHSSGTSIAFGFCPIVDELQAFNLSGVGSVLNGLSSSVNVSIYVYGQGTAMNPTETKPLANAAVFAASPANTCPSGEVAVVDFLLLRIPTTRGLYTYQNNESYPDTAGFTPTCDTHDRCLYSSGKVCIGEAHLRNCAACYKTDALSNTRTVVWTAYYGTDSNGKGMLSGSSSPSEFQRFSLGSLDAMSQVFGE